MERRRRVVARVALYGSLLLVLVATALAQRFLRLPEAGGAETAWSQVDWKARSEVRLFQQFLRVDTSADSGDELAGLLFLATPLEAAGFQTEIVRVGERHAILWAELQGEERRPLVLLSHIDVESVHDAASWEHPPFAGVVEPPYIHGRGSFDMKSYTVAQLLALLRLKAEHPRPRRSVLLLVVGDEEAGSDFGTRWLLRERPELVRSFWAVLTEGGAVEARNLESIKYWGTEVGQKRFPEITACAPSRERLEQLRQDLYENASTLRPIVVEPGIREFWKIYHPTRDVPQLRRLIADPDALTRDAVGFLSLPGYLRAMLRNDLSVWPPEPSAGGGWQMRIVLHLLPTADLESARRELLPEWATAGVTLTMTRPVLLAAPSPSHHPVMRAIDAELRQRYGDDVPAGPLFLPWTASDGRFLRPLGIPSYGFTPFLILSPETMRAHRPNEKISLPGFVDGVDMYAQVVERIVVGP